MTPPAQVPTYGQTWTGEPKCWEKGPFHMQILEVGPWISCDFI